MCSLGIVLLEIGFWKSLESFHLGAAGNVSDKEKHKHYKQNQSILIEMANTRLPGQVGNLYMNAVKACLSVTEGDSDAVTSENLCWNVCAVLDQCVA